MNQRLDEQALRRPVFRGGYPVMLLDGQRWFFPDYPPGSRRDRESERGLSIDELRFLEARDAFEASLRSHDPFAVLRVAQEVLFDPFKVPVRFGADEPAPEVRALAAAARARRDTATEIVRLLFAMVRRALDVNYDLDGVALSDLLRMRFDPGAEGPDAEPCRIGRQVLEACLTGN